MARNRSRRSAIDPRIRAPDGTEKTRQPLKYARAKEII